MKTKQKAPRNRGSTSKATASSDRSGSESSAVTSAVSVVLPRPISPGCRSSSPCRAAMSSRNSAELMRLPLCASATVVVSVPPSVGWAFSQVEPPVVE
jgi:hypothetical protein